MPYLRNQTIANKQKHFILFAKAKLHKRRRFHATSRGKQL